MLDRLVDLSALVPLESATNPPQDRREPLDLALQGAPSPIAEGQYGQLSPSASVVRCIEVRPDAITVKPCRDFTSARNAVWGINARSPLQVCALDALHDRAGVLLAGPAGSGKRLLALAAGLDACIEARKYQRIVWTSAYRLDTTRDERARLERNIEHRLQFLIESNNQLEWGRAAAGDLCRRYIQWLTTREICGSWLSNAIVIMESADRASIDELLDVAERVAPNSKLVLIADVRQQTCEEFVQSWKHKAEALAQAPSANDLLHAWLPRT